MWWDEYSLQQVLNQRGNLILLAYAGSRRRRGHYTSKAHASTYEGWKSIKWVRDILQKNYDETHAPHHHYRTWVSPGIFQRSPTFFEAAHFAGGSRRHNLFPSNNTYCTTERPVQSRVHRRNRCNGIFHRIHYYYSHSAAKKILAAESVVRSLSSD